VHERFWGFFNPQAQNAEGLAEYILEQLNVVLSGDRDKLIAEMYDGAAVISVIRRKPSSSKKKESNYSNLLSAKEVCRTIICQSNERFAFTKHLSAEKLFNPSFFQENAMTVPFLPPNLMKLVRPTLSCVKNS
jgi:hypothetical protein